MAELMARINIIQWDQQLAGHCLEMGNKVAMLVVAFGVVRLSFWFDLEVIPWFTSMQVFEHPQTLTS